MIGLDLDGVLWRGSEPIDGSADAVDSLRAGGFTVAFLTNNANPTLEAYVDKLAGMGVAAEPGDFVTSAQAAARVLERQIPANSRVLVCGGPGLVEAVSRRGFDVVVESPAEAVVVGYDPSFDYGSLDRASEAVRSGAHFVAANIDPTFPSGDRLLPGNGALVAAVATAGVRSPRWPESPRLPTPIWSASASAAVA
ncbi:MAG: hypothetical protein M5U31_12085 [Acidimicrobiia bacterium]|nr:hypothetical protein [Acidimicrobiia bacterium]